MKSWHRINDLIEHNIPFTIFRNGKYEKGTVCGVRNRNLTGTYYNCIFNEKTGRTDINNRHCHLVKRAWQIIDVPGSIRNGIAYEGLNGNIIFGCQLKNFMKNTNGFPVWDNELKEK